MLVQEAMLADHFKWGRLYHPSNLILDRRCLDGGHTVWTLDKRYAITLFLQLWLIFSIWNRPARECPSTEAPGKPPFLLNPTIPRPALYITRGAFRSYNTMEELLKISFGSFRLP
jgi:hypothetical protein